MVEGAESTDITGPGKLRLLSAASLTGWRQPPDQLKFTIVGCKSSCETGHERLRLPSHACSYEVVVLELIGEADFATAPHLDAALNGTQILSSPPGLLVLLDLSRLDFCDMVALRVMAVAARRLAERGARLALAAPQRRFLRLLEITRLDGYFEVLPSLPGPEESVRRVQSAVVLLKA
jgi:anti-sigma B factor antagonist